MPWAGRQIYVASVCTFFAHLFCLILCYHIITGRLEMVRKHTRQSAGDRMEEGQVRLKGGVLRSGSDSLQLHWVQHPLRLGDRKKTSFKMSDLEMVMSTEFSFL